MQNKHLTHAVKTIRVMNAVAAGTTDQTSSVVDTQGYLGVRFVALFGTLTASQVTSIYAEQDTVVGMGAAAAIANSRVGPLADTDSNKALILDIFKPRERFVRCVIDRGTANAVIDGVIAELYSAGDEPVAKDASVAFQEVHSSPAEGSA